MKTTLFGIKNCDTVKKACKWLEHQSVSYDFHDFRLDGLEKAQVITWIEALGIDTLINKRSTTWKQLSDNDKTSLNERSAVALILENPTLIKRPLVQLNHQYHVGFNEKTWQTLFATS